MDWVPHPDAEVEVNTDGDMVYSKMPKIIYAHFPGATWVIHPDLGEGVYPITPKSRTWELNKHTGISVRRTSYFVLPDFGATAHMCQGQTLDAAFVDPLESWVSVNVEDAVKVYVMLSRVRLLANLVIMQPFSPWLFQQGSPPGPDILMKKLRGDIAPERATTAFEEAERKREERQGKASKGFDPMRRKYRCTHCYLSGRTDCEKGVHEFGVTCPEELLTKILFHGAWTRCVGCEDVARKMRDKGNTRDEGNRRDDESLRSASGQAATSDATGDYYCSRCKRSLTKGHFAPSVLKNRDRKPDLVCRGCSVTKCTGECGRVLKNNDFRVVKGVQSDACKKCEEFPCSRRPTCTGVIRGSKRKAADITNFVCYGNPLVCDACGGRGITPGDLREYTCVGCGIAKGHKLFDPQVLNNFNKTVRLYIVCLDCARQNQERARGIKRKMKMPGTFQCRCLCPIHTEKCPMWAAPGAPRKWVGKHKADPSKGVTADDHLFYEQMRKQGKV